MNTHLIERDGLRFATEAFGRPGDTPILMIMGATASMLWWPEGLCRRIAAAGRYVVRYDNRDTGRSTSYPPGAPPYTMDDMADDALTILDGHGLDRAHLVGMSLGGMIAQLAALKAPARVASLTLISSCAFDEDDPDLPPMDPALGAHFAEIATLDWHDRQAVVDFQVESARISAGTSFDAAAARDLAEREYDRADDPRAALNHSLLGGGEAWAGRVGEIAAPTVVIHGRRDPILSFRHGEKLAAKIPGARLVALEGGHELNARDWPVLADEILAITG